MLYFAYGANTHHAMMAHRCAGASFLGQAVLPGHELVFRGVADIRPAADKTVTGALWDIDEQDLAALDRFEGYPNLYTRHGVSVLLDRKRHGFDRALAIIYQMSTDRQLSPPADAYLNTLVQGYTDCGLPEEQIGTALSTAFAEHDGELYRSRIWGQHGDRYAY